MRLAETCLRLLSILEVHDEVLTSPYIPRTHELGLFILHISTLIWNDRGQNIRSPLRLSCRVKPVHSNGLRTVRNFAKAISLCHYDVVLHIACSLRRFRTLYPVLYTLGPGQVNNVKLFIQNHATSCIPCVPLHSISYSISFCHVLLSIHM